MRIKVDTLVEKGNLYILHKLYLATAIRGVQSRENLQQRTLARSVGGNQCDLVALVDVERDITEEDLVAV